MRLKVDFESEQKAEAMTSCIPSAQGKPSSTQNFLHYTKLPYKRKGKTHNVYVPKNP